MQKLMVFGAVGVGASLVHIAVAWALMGWLQAGVFAANVTGFCTAFLWSYFGHYYLTFRARNAHRAAFGRFLAVALMGFAINNGVVWAWGAVIGQPGILAITLGVIIAAGTVFVASNFWAFASAPHTSAPHTSAPHTSAPRIRD